MSLQPKSHILSVPVDHTSHPRTNTNPAYGPGNLPVVSTLQSLAAELHQSATGGVFEYSRNWTLATRITSGVLVTLAMLHLAIVGVPVLQGASPTWGLATGVLGLFFAVAIAAVLCNLSSQVQITPQGIGVSELIGWRRIPWQQVQTLRVMELPNNRYVVMAPIEGSTRPRTPVPMLKIIPNLIGASRNGDGGIIFTSNIKNFERLLQLMVAYMGQAAGQGVPTIEAFVDEDGAMPMAQLFLDPPSALTRLSHRPQFTEMSLDTFGGPRPEIGPNVPWLRVLLRQMLIAAVPALLLAVEMLADPNALSSMPWQFFWVGAVLLLGVIELLFVAKLLQTVGDIMVGRGQFRRSVWAYLELQAPRVALIFLGTTLTMLGLPPFIAQALWLIGILFTTVLSTQFVQRLYFIRTSQALLASVGAFLFQISLFAIYFTSR